MNKFSIFLLSLLVAGATLAATYTNRIGQVVTVGDDGIVTSVSDPTVPGSNTNTIVGISGDAQVDFATANADVGVKLLTPRQICDFAIFLAGTNGAVYMSAGVTTNDWIELGN